MGCTPSSTLNNTEGVTCIDNYPRHVRCAASAFHRDDLPTVHFRATAGSILRTSSISSTAAIDVGRTHRRSTSSRSARHPGSTGGSGDMMLVSSMTSDHSQPLSTAAEMVQSLAQFGSKSSEPMLPDETSPPLNNAAEGAPSEPSSVAVGAVVPLVQVGMDLEMVASVTSHYNDSVTGVGTSMPLGVEAGGGSTSMQRRRDRDRQSLIRFEPPREAHRSSTSMACSDYLGVPLFRGTTASSDNSRCSPVGQHVQQNPRFPFLRITIAHQPSLEEGSARDVRLCVGGDELQHQSRHTADHNARRLLQSQQSLCGDASTSAAWFMDDMSRLAIAVQGATSTATEDEEAHLWYDDYEFGASTAV